VNRPAPAGPWRRFVCIAYECVLLFGVLFLFAYAFSALTQFKAAPGPLRSVFQGFLWAVLALYFSWFWSGGRRSLPMKTLQLRLVDRAGRSLGWPRALLRFTVITLLMLAALWAAHAIHRSWLLAIALPFGWSGFDPERRALYDLLSGTRLAMDPADSLASAATV
jgi:uncharacterized RDD family membrane protein YckC